MDHSARAARLGLLGGECTGKSTLAAELTRRLHGCLVGEYLREFVDATGRTPLRHEQAGILQAQQEREDEAARTCPGRLIVADPAVLMTAAYSIVYFDDDSLVERAVDGCRGYDLLVWCDIDLPWVPDGAQRDGPDFRLREDRVLSDLVASRLAPLGLRVVRVSGPPEVRLTAVLRAWQPRPPAVPT